MRRIADRSDNCAPITVIRLSIIDAGRRALAG
jgi:hypothetical protein